MLFPTMAPFERQVLPRDVRVRQQVLRTRWCGVCKLYPSPRAHHCRVCNRCVADFHYHSDILGCDIAARNILSFAAFLVFATLSICYCAAMSALLLYQLSQPVSATTVQPPGIFFFTHRQGCFTGALSMAPLAVVLFAGGCLLLPLLIVQLLRLLLWALHGETGQQRRSRKSISRRLLMARPANPFGHATIAGNIASVLCLPWHTQVFDEAHGADGAAQAAELRLPLPHLLAPQPSRRPSSTGSTAHVIIMGTAL